MPYSLAESPTGLVHYIHVYGNNRADTYCGREVNWDRWTRIRMFDEKIFSKGPRAIKALIELPVCDKCFKT